MIKIYCDRCKKEIEESNACFTMKFENQNNKISDLNDAISPLLKFSAERKKHYCAECKDAIMKFADSEV
jgi:ribosomal protein S26